MAILHTQINTRSPEFAANSAAMLAQVNELRALLSADAEDKKAANATPAKEENQLPL